MSKYTFQPRSFIMASFFSISTLGSTSVIAAGFQQYEQGTLTIGTASVGQAVVDDASASYFNPACMSLIGDTELQLGSQLAIREIRFRQNALNTFTGGHGSNAGNWFPGATIYAVTSCTDDLKFGLSITSPFSAVFQYQEGWAGRYFVQNNQLSTLNANLSLAYSLNEMFSFGLGVFGEYAQLHQRTSVALNSPGLVDFLDGQADLRLRSVRPGVTLGILFMPCGEATRIGLSYRSPVHHKPRGNISFLRVATTPTVTANLRFPQSLIASLSQDITDDFTLLAEIGWSNWSRFSNPNMELIGITPLPARHNWRDTYRLGLGGQYILCENYLLQAGASYDSSPCNATSRLPDLPFDRQLRFGTGLVYTTLECVTFGLQYEFIDYGKAKIDNVTRLGTLSGDYAKNFANVLSLSINFKF